MTFGQEVDRVCSYNPGARTRRTFWTRYANNLQRIDVLGLLTSPRSSPGPIARTL